jgi:predicted RNase H-like HicB family nuclease
MTMQFTAVVHRGEKCYVGYCPELEVVSQGETVEEARRNLGEAVELFLECADQREIEGRLHRETYISPLEVTIG